MSQRLLDVESTGGEILDIDLYGERRSKISPKNVASSVIIQRGCGERMKLLAAASRIIFRTYVGHFIQCVISHRRLT